jgi:hypothetical protein
MRAPGQWKVTIQSSSAVDLDTHDPTRSYVYFRSRDEALNYACERQPTHRKAVLIEGPNESMDEDEIAVRCRDFQSKE